jgi:hippurate hydrolase
MAHVLTSEKVFPRMVELRRYLHRHPELAFEEKKTASIVIDELKRLVWRGG